MTKVIDCVLIEPGWACSHVIQAAGEAEALRLAAMHARSHGTEPSAALLARARALMRDEGGSLPVWEAAARGQQILAAQRYEIANAVESGDQVALEVLWIGTPAVAIGSIPAGGEMRVFSGMFLRFRDGRIAAQRNYDCFEPF